MEQFPEIGCYADFTAALCRAGMTPGGPNGGGVFTLCDFFGPNIAWHTGDPETDPWEWRIRVLEEREDIAYGKLFFRNSGYVTREWLPALLAVRRGGAEPAGLLEEDPLARRVYGLVRENGPLPLHILKELAFVSKEEQKHFEKILTALQGSLFLTLCGRARKRSCSGAEYGWASTVFCTVEHRFGEEVLRQADKLGPDRAYEALRAQLSRLNPQVDGKKADKFLLAR